MRTFFLSLAVFCLIIGILIFTGRYLIKQTEELSEAANSLPIITEEKPLPQNEINTALRKLTETWHSAKKAIHFLVGHDEADKIDDNLAELRIRAVTHDTAGYMTAREKLLQSLTRLADSESFSFDTVT